MKKEVSTFMMIALIVILGVDRVFSGLKSRGVDLPKMAIQITSIEKQQGTFDARLFRQAVESWSRASVRQTEILQEFSTEMKLQRQQMNLLMERLWAERTK